MRFLLRCVTGIRTVLRSSLLELINKHSFFAMRTKDRYGVPDEARPNIFVKSGANEHAG